MNRDAIAAIINDRTMINDEGFVQNSEEIADAILALESDIERKLEHLTYALRQAFTLLVADEAIDKFNGSISPARTMVLEQVRAALEKKDQP